MAKQTVGLCKTFVCDTALPQANVALVMSGTNAGNVALPGGALAMKFVGIAREAVSSGSQSRAIEVQLSGVAQVQSDGSGVINAGDYVAIGNSGGQVRSLSPASGTNARAVIGIALSGAAATAGLLVDVHLMPCVFVGA
jgi:hypothetical protein